MHRLWLLCALLLPHLGWAQGDAGVAVDEVRQLMHEGLEKHLPAPAAHARPEWPRAEAARPPAPPRAANPGAPRIDAMAERLHKNASARIHDLAEEKRTTPDNQPGASQTRTKAAKTAPPRSPPRP